MSVAAFDPLNTERRDAFLGGLRDSVEYAFQPIVNVHTGVPFGFEALLRGHERLGFDNIEGLLDHAFGGDDAVAADHILRDKALASFMRIETRGNARLFYNMDSRVSRARDYQPEAIPTMLERHGLSPLLFCIECSEAHIAADPRTLQALLRRHAGFHIAIDDFGTGYSGLRLLYEIQPDMVKVDRFFIAGLDEDQKKKVFLSAIVNLAHVLGIAVVAEGVETEDEFRICREIGCDYIQGFFIARPTTALDGMQPHYTIVADTNRNDRRDLGDSSHLVRNELESLKPLCITVPMSEVLEALRRSPNRPFLPVVDEQDQPLGIVVEADFKEFVYSPFGKDLLTNRATPYRLEQFLKPSLVCEVSASTDHILAAFALHKDDPAILIAEDGRYLGVLHATAMLRIMNERTLYLARNENPLTRLPGNASIADYLARAFEDVASGWVFAYFDLDNFKPFNDHFGFRQGDRAILMFADLLRGQLNGTDIFLAHIGGDDFFAGMRGPLLPAFRQEIEKLLAKFADDVASFYDPADRIAGFITAQDRMGRPMRFALLSASCALLVLPPGKRMASLDEMSMMLAELKKQAKASSGKIAVETIGPAGMAAQGVTPAISAASAP